MELRREVSYNMNYKEEGPKAQSVNLQNLVMLRLHRAEYSIYRKV